MSSIKELIQSIESTDSSFDEMLEAINKMEETLVAMRQQEETAVQDNVDLIVEAIKVMENKVTAQLEVAKSIVPEKGDKGDKGADGKQGKDGRDGKDGLNGKDGKDGQDGQDGVSVRDAKIDFDGSLVITLSTGQELNVGEVVAPDLAEKIKVISTMSTNGAVAVLDEGTSITSGVKKINFVGATVTATNSGDDVTVNVSAGTGTVTSVAATAGTGISITGSPITTTGTLNITNTAPDQTVALTGAGTTSITGTYPNFTITSNDSATGTVTSVAALTVGTTGTDLGSTVANGTTTPVITLNVPTASATNRGALSSADWTTFNSKGSGTVTSVTGTSPVSSSGGTTPAISMAAATASVNGYLTSTDWTTFNGKGSGTVTSVAALTLGTTGTDLSSTVANGTTTPVITLNVPTASASNRGVLSSADWTTFNGKGAGTVTSVAATVPAFLSVAGSPITTSGTLAITLSGTALPVVNGGTGVTTSTGSGNVVLSTSPSLTTPVLGTPTSGTLSNCTVDGTDAVGFRNVPVNSQSAAYTLVLADSGKTILHPSGDANARTFTIPSNASVAYAVGTVITFINMTSQVVTIAINTDTMYLSSAGTTGSRSLAQYGSATALKITSTNWLISGSGLT